MPLMWRVTERWSGGQIGSGFTNLHFTEGIGTAQQAADAVKQFFDDVYLSSGGNLPTGVTLQSPSSVDIVDPVSGTLINSIPVTGAKTLSGAASGTYAAPAGACITWTTSGVVDGHRVAGRTFLVPLASTKYQADGTIDDPYRTTLLTAAAALVAAAPELTIWHRPESKALGGGSMHPVLALRLSDKVAILRSRR